MEDNKNHIKPFGLIKKNIENDPMAPKYIKPDGTKVIEQTNEYGLTVYEICPDRTLISRTYTKNDKLFSDYIRKGPVEIGHLYDEFEQLIYEYNTLYDEKNNIKKNIELSYKYHDNGNKSQELSITTPGNTKIEILYDKQGNRIEKIEHKGSVKTWFDKNDKPIKREIDRGSGGIVTEDLRNK